MSSTKVTEQDKRELAWGYLQILNYYKAGWIWRLPKEKIAAKKLAKEIFYTILEIDGITGVKLHPVKTCWDITGRLIYKPYRSALKSANRNRNP
jgi:hypothetical protein